MIPNIVIIKVELSMFGWLYAGESGESGATKPTQRFSSKYPFFEKTVISSYLDTQVELQIL